MMMTCVFIAIQTEFSSGYLYTLSYSWKPTPVADEDAFEAIKAGIDTLPAGVKMILNSGTPIYRIHVHDHLQIFHSGEFYGTNPRTANLELLARFFDKYPTYTDKVFLSVKGGTGPADIDPDSSPENIRRSVDTVLKALRGTKKIDLFECARVDSRVAIEDNIATLANLVKEGKFDHIGMSECAAATLRRGNAVRNWWFELVRFLPI